MKYEIGQEVYYVYHNKPGSCLNRIKNLLATNYNFSNLHNSPHLGNWESSIDLDITIKKGIVSGIMISPQSFEVNKDKTIFYILDNNKIREDRIFLDIEEAKDYIYKYQETQISDIIFVKQEIDKRCKLSKENEKIEKIVFSAYGKT